MKKAKVFLAGILVIFALVLAAHTITQTSRVTTPQKVFYADDEGGPIYPDPIFAPRIPDNIIL